MATPLPTRPRRDRLLRLVSWIVPRAERAAWHAEWLAEFEYADRSGGIQSGRLAAALRHACWLRWHRRRIDMLRQDIQHALRSLAHRPAFTAAAALTLAIGIGASTAIYSSAHAVLWRPLPYPDPDRIVLLSTTTAQAPDAVGGSVSPPDFNDWRQRAGTIAAMAAVTEAGYPITGDGQAEHTSGAVVTGAFFDVLGVRAAHGRTLTVDDDAEGGPAVAVLGHALWMRRYGGDAAAIGRSITLAGLPRTIVGIMPRGFASPARAEIWTPLRFTTQELATQRGAHYLTVIGRLAPAATLEAARAEMAAINVSLAKQYSHGDELRVSVHPLRTALVGDVRPAMLLLLVAVGLLFLVACVNVAGLVLAASLGRGRDLALRAALGASRGRLVRTQLVESVLVALAGGLSGLLVASLGVRAIATLDQAGIPMLDETRLDLPVLLFAALATAASAVLFGLLPAWRSSGGNLVDRLRSADGRATVAGRRSRSRTALVASEVALAVALLVGAALVGRSFLGLVGVELGFDAAGVQTYWLSLSTRDYAVEKRAPFLDDVLARTTMRPDVESAGAIFGLPLGDINYYISGFERDGEQLSREDQHRLTVQLRVVTPDYFRAMRIPVTRGRPFAASDRHEAEPVAILNETAARLIWPDGDPIGRTFRIGTRLGLGGTRVGGRIVGVTGDVRDGGPAAGADPMLYVTHWHFPVDVYAIVVRSRTDALVPVDDLGAIVASLDPNLPPFRARSMDDLAADAVARPRLYVLLLGLFAGVALTLAAVGIYGVLSQMVYARRREMGVRLALGARRVDVVGLVVVEALQLAVAGVAVGCLLAWLARALVARLLVDVAATDPATYGLVAAFATVVALLAAWLPAHRASRVDPATALRAE